MLKVVVVQALVLGYALRASLRARFALGLVALAAVALFTLLLPVLVLTESAGPLGEWCAAFPYVPPLLAAGVAGYAARRAFQLHDAEREALLRAKHLETAGFALLGATLLDVAYAVLAAIFVFIDDSPL